MGALLFGFDTGVISGAILGIADDFHLTSAEVGFVVSSLLFGAACGALLAGRFADRFGRRPVLFVAGTLFAVGTIGVALAPGLVAMAVWRLCLGVAVGFASVLVPLYLSEIAPTAKRGSIASLNQLMIMVGILMAAVVNVFAGTQWRWALGVGVVPAVLLILGLFLMPETPRWLVMHGRGNDAKALLQRLRAKDDVDGELEEIREVDRLGTSSAKGFRELLQPWVRPVVIVGIGLAIFQQIQGINVIIYYLPTSLTNSGMSNEGAIAVNLGVAALNVIMTIVAICIVDKIGRRTLLSWGSAGMVVSLGAVTVAGAMSGADGQADTAATVVLIAGSCGFIVSYAMSWGPLLWVLLGEIFPLHIRGAAMAVATAALWVANIAVSTSFPVMLSDMGQAITFGMYTAICLASFFFVRFFVPETRGRSLERIELDMRSRAKPIANRET